MPGLETEDGQAIDLGGDGPGADQAPPQLPPRQEAPAPPKAPPRRRGRPPRAEQARVTGRTTAAALTDEQRAEGVKGITQIGAGVMLLAAKATGKDAFKADAVTIASTGDDAAKACVQLAHSDPKFAAALDKVCSAGPYAALITIAVGAGSQIARNHRPSLAIPGTVHPDELLNSAEEGSDVRAAA